MDFGRAGLYFFDKLPGRLPYWAKSSGPWAVRVAKKSARTISTVLMLIRLSQSLVKVSPYSEKSMVSRMTTLWLAGAPDLVLAA